MSETETEPADAPAPRDVETVLAEYTAAHNAKEQLLTEVQELNAEISQLNRARDATVSKLQLAIKLRARLKEEYARVSGGFDASKATRLRVEEDVDRARGKLLAAICDPGNLPLEDPVVLHRLAEFRDAYNAMRRAHAARIAAKCKRAA